ncbi:CorA family divalent cation transporter [Kitasatospora acidiphila]|uniref:CorA family divalent cation transporter n=1 Tax=Kitasatospora acidiphila TaxID=2567942 RepID=UPI0015F02E19|nr:CorA family divalent cation transporter [Kitasatospora acidiphila]
MIVDSARYRDGRRLAGPGTAAPDDGFLWIGLAEPGEAEFAQVGAVAGLPAALVAQALRTPRAAGVTRYPQALLVVLPTVERPAGRQHALTTGQLLVLVGESFVLTVRHGPSGPMRGLRARLERQPRLLAGGPTAVLHEVCAATVDGCLTALAADPGSRVLRAAARQALAPLRELAAGPLPGLRAGAEQLAAECGAGAAPQPGRAPQPVQAAGSEQVPHAERAPRPEQVPHAEQEPRPGRAPHAEQEPGPARAPHDEPPHAEPPSGELPHAEPPSGEPPHAELPSGELRRLGAWVALAVPPLLLSGYALAGQASAGPYGYPLAIGATALVCGILHRLFKRGGWL